MDRNGVNQIVSLSYKDDFIIITRRNVTSELVSPNFTLLTSVSIERNRLSVIRKRILTIRVGMPVLPWSNL